MALHLMTNMATVFDETSKMWLGWKSGETLDDSVSVGEWALRMMRNKSPNEICQITDIENTELTYQQALFNAIKLAKQMRKWQLTCYDVVAVVAINDTYTMPIILATWFNGLPFHAVNPDQKEEAIHYLLNKSKPKVIFCNASHVATLRNTLQTFDPIVCTLCNDVDNNFDVIKIRDLLDAEDDENIDLFCTVPLKDGNNQTVAILCTSGTIGLPKCVRITNKMCLTDYGFLSDKSSTIFSFCHIDWIFGLYGLLGNILYGNLRIITSLPYSADYMTAVIAKYKIDYLLTTSNQISQCIRHNQQFLQTLKFVLISGSFCFKDTLLRIRNSIKSATVINIYGTSECGGISANFGKYKPKSVGQLFPNVELKIVDMATGEKLGPYEMGLVCVKNNFHISESAYFSDVEAFYKMFDKDDFIITGDLGCMDSEHYLYLTDRREVVLRYHNLYYSPHEFELIVAEMADVQDVCVVGILEEVNGDMPAAVVVKDTDSSLTERDIVNYVNLRVDSLHNCFDYGVFFIREIPRNHNGKVLTKDVVEICKHLKNKVKH